MQHIGRICYVLFKDGGTVGIAIAVVVIAAAIIYQVSNSKT